MDNESTTRKHHFKVPKEEVELENVINVSKHQQEEVKVEGQTAWKES